MKSRLLALLLPFVVGACAVVPSDADRLRDARFVLLGEVHDNPLHHEQRAQLLAQLLKDGKPTVVVFEQMSRDRNAELAAAPRTAEAQSEAGQLDRKGWRWPLHQPIFDAALTGGAQLRGGNISREQARALVTQLDVAWPADLAPLKARTPWSEAQQQTQLNDIEQSHCGAMPASLMPGMVLAQRARDAAMAQAMLDAAAKGAARVVLIAGNGHVRRDLAVPIYLEADGVPAAQIFSQAWLEGDAEPERYDAVVQTAAVQREDPCAAFKRP